jgi:hypothetical protein
MNDEAFRKAVATVHSLPLVPSYTILPPATFREVRILLGMCVHERNLNTCDDPDCIVESVMES